MTAKISDRGPPVESSDDARLARAAAKIGCDNLLRAQLRHRCHWITDRAVFDETLAKLRRGE